MQHTLHLIYTPTNIAALNQERAYLTPVLIANVVKTLLANKLSTSVEGSTVTATSSAGMFSSSQKQFGDMNTKLFSRLCSLAAKLTTIH